MNVHGVKRRAHMLLTVVTLRFSNGPGQVKDTCSNATSNGHLELLKWARANQCFSEDTCSKAAACGHLLQLLKSWARANAEQCAY